jgi:lysophospholipase L1-like esterase
MITKAYIHRILFIALAIGIISGAIVVYLSSGSGTKIVSWGDSLTFGVGADKTGGYTNILREDGYNVLLRGYPGQTSTEIAIHQGAIGVELIKNAKSGDYLVKPEFFGDFRKREEISFSGAIGKNPVRLTRYETGEWRAFGASLNECGFRCKFISSESINEKRTKNIIWVGRNNNLKFTRFIFRDISLIVNSLPEESSFLVVGLTPAQDDTSEQLEAIKDLNGKLREAYGENFIDMWSALAGRESGKISESLYSDHVHFNDKGYMLIASTIRKKL